MNILEKNFKDLISDMADKGKFAKNDKNRNKTNEKQFKDLISNMAHEMRIAKNEKNRKCRDCSNIIDYKPRMVRCPDCYKKHTNYSNSPKCNVCKEDD
jgi:hypothetical protein